jgi:hypothetical protein
MLPATARVKTGKFQPRRLDEYEEVVGLLDGVEKVKGERGSVMVTLVHRQAFVLSLHDRMLGRLFESVGRQVAFALIDGSCRFRLIGDDV